MARASCRDRTKTKRKGRICLTLGNEAVAVGGAEAKEVAAKDAA